MLERVTTLCGPTNFVASLIEFGTGVSLRTDQVIGHHNNQLDFFFANKDNKIKGPLTDRKVQHPDYHIELHRLSTAQVLLQRLSENAQQSERRKDKKQAAADVPNGFFRNVLRNKGAADDSNQCCEGMASNSASCHTCTPLPLARTSLDIRRVVALVVK